MKSLKHLYQIFMWQNVHPQINFEFNDVLVAGFVVNYYLIVLKSKFQELEYTIIVDNIKKPIQITIDSYPNKDNYHTFSVKQLKMLPKKLNKELNRRGLFMTDKDRSKYDGWTSIHRLICCIYSNCKGFPIHHIDKDKGNNCQCNLVPITQELNNEIEKLFTQGEYQKAKSKGRGLWVEQEEKIKEQIKCKKIYNTDNDRIQMDIIKYGITTHKTNVVIKKFRPFIRTQQKIRNILNYFFYKDKFIKWLIGYTSKMYSKEDMYEL